MNERILRRNNVKTFGKGEQFMVFAHGFGCDQTMWRFITSSFEDDYKIVLFDYVGAGGSDKSAYHSERYSKLNGYALDVIEVCDALKIRDAIFVGHSVSCMIGLLASIRRRELFCDLVLIGPSPRYINGPGYTGGFERKDIEQLMEAMDKNYTGWASMFAPLIMGNPDKPQLAEELRSSFCSTDPRIVREFAVATFFSDNRKDLLDLDKPSLIMQCSDDVLAPCSVGEYLHAHLQNSTLKGMKATGHCPHMSHPEETIQIMEDYLRR